MILLKISNASEVVASKLGQFLEGFTPEDLDQSTVEDLVVRKMIDNLVQEGVEGEISILRGIDLKEDQLIISKGFRVSNHKIS